MPDKSKRQSDAASTLSAAYNLHREAVDDLVSAEASNAPRYSGEELNRYRSGKTRRRFPEWLKAVLIKFWFYGAICYFVFWGMGLYVKAELDLYFAAALVMGIVGDLLINHFLRFTERMPGGSRKWIMVQRGGAAGMVFSVMYAFVLLAIIVTVYHAINAALSALGMGHLGVEPLLFGLIATGADSLCILCRNTMASIISDARKGS